MTSGDVASSPRYTFEATRRRGMGFEHAVRLDFYDGEMRIYRHVLHFARDSDLRLVRRAAYSEIRRCAYLAPRVESSRLTLVGFLWADMPAEIELSISGPRSGPARPGTPSLWSLEKLRFRGTGMSNSEFQEVYAWLRARRQHGPSAAA